MPAAGSTERAAAWASTLGGRSQIVGNIRVLRNSDGTATEVIPTRDTKIHVIDDVGIAMDATGVVVEVSDYYPDAAAGQQTSPMYRGMARCESGRIGTR